MKNLIRISLIIFYFLYSCTAFGTSVRGMWVITWEVFGSTYDKSKTSDDYKAKIIEVFDNLKTANFNTVYWQVRQGATAYYRSSYEPWGKYLGYKDPGFDPLSFAIKQAHQRGIKLHAWVNTYEARSVIPGAPGFEHPEWVCRDGYNKMMPSKTTLSPANRNVKNYLSNVIYEIAKNYDVDGIHLDYVRWTEYHTGNINTKQRFETDLENKGLKFMPGIQLKERYLYDNEHKFMDGIPRGYKTWQTFWRFHVTDFVKILSKRIRKIKPKVIISPAAIGKYNWGSWNGYHAVFQDVALWFNEGYVDMIAGMNYHWLTVDGLYNSLEGDCPKCWKKFVQPGVKSGRVFSVGLGSYLFDDDHWSRHEDMLKMIETLPWITGVQFFSYDSWDRNDYWYYAGTVLFPLD